MDRRTIPILLCLAALCLSAYGKDDKHTQGLLHKVVFLPVVQSDIEKLYQIDENLITNALQEQFCRLENAQLVLYRDFFKGRNKELIDHAVFELLVTDDLKDTLALMDDQEKPTREQKTLCQSARQQGIDSLVLVNIRQEQTQLHVFYEIIDAKTGCTVTAKSYYDLPNDPVGVANHLARKILPTFWMRK